MAEAVLGALVDNLNAAITSKLGLVQSARKEMEKLSGTLTTIRSVLEGAEVKQFENPSIQDWLRKLKHAAYDAEDILDDWLFGGSQSGFSNLRLLSRLDFRTIVFRYKIAKRIREMRERFDEIAKEKSDFDLREGMEGRVEELNHRNRETSFVMTEPEVYGRDIDKEKIVRLLLECVDNCIVDDDGVLVCPVIGIGGVGKTTLAQMVYNDERVVKHFEVNSWVCVGEVFDLTSLGKKIIETFGNCCNLASLAGIQSELQKVLNGKRFLIVLDDVWNEDQGEWNKLKGFLMGGAKGSAVVITTRLQTVASITGTVPEHHLDALSQDDCWSLFKQYAFGMGNEENVNLEKIGHEIVKKCRGIPLAAKALGSLLRFESEENQWSYVRDNEIWNLKVDGENAILPALRLSYNNLAPNLRRCFAYCSLFPKDYEMRKGELIRLWIANGFIQSDGIMELEEIGGKTFNKLMWRSFFQDVRKDDYGNVEGCKMHDLLHDLASSVTVDESLLLEVSNVNNIPQKIRHLSLFHRSLTLNILEPVVSSQPLLRTLVLGGFTSIKPHIISHLKCLRVLHLGGGNVTTLLRSIGNLRHLRYLNLSGCGIQSLPDSLCRLRNLQMLNLSYNGFRTLPSSIGNLKQLRYLNLSCNGRMTLLPKSIGELRNLQKLVLWYTALRVLPEGIKNMCNLRYLEIGDQEGFSHMPIGFKQLTNLQRLNYFIVSSESEGGASIKELQGLNLLKEELTIKRLEHVTSSQEAQAANLSSKRNLSVLKLIWSDDAGNADNSKGVLEGLKPHPNIQKLQIKGYPGVKFPNWMEMGDPPLLFPSLIEISLFHLPNLEVWSWNCKEIENFPSLQYLCICQCHKLKTLPNELGNLTKLSSLNIHGCEELVSLPQGMQNLTSLKSLQISGCHSLRSLPKMGIEGPQSSLEDLCIDNCKDLISLSGGLQYLTSLENLRISNCPELEFSMEDFNHLIALRELSLLDCPKLISLPKGLEYITRLQTLIIKGCSGLRALPELKGSLTSLQHLGVHHCHSLRSLPKMGIHGSKSSLETLLIDSCDTLIALFECLQYLTSLNFLRICHCPSLEFSSEDFDHLSVLRSVELLDCPKLAYLPEGLQRATTLQTLTIQNCQGFMNLPEWIGDLKSLYALRISSCENLRMLPEGLKHLINLFWLVIENCHPDLHGRCEKDKGDDWHKISHVPEIEIYRSRSSSSSSSSSNSKP